MKNSPETLKAVIEPQSYWVESTGNLTTWKQTGGDTTSVTATSSGTQCCHGYSHRQARPCTSYRGKAVDALGFLLCFFCHLCHQGHDRQSFCVLLCKVRLITWQGCYNETKNQRERSLKPLQSLSILLNNCYGRWFYTCYIVKAQ